jgi:hypothetical protein
MKIKLLTFCLLLTIFSSFKIKADEGIWIPLLIEKYNIKLMQEKGFKLSAEDIYSVNKACMKDAVVQFGSGCTGEIISSDGLLITNYHCGQDQIQKHSALEHDYLTKGFWAMSHAEELPNPGLTVMFLVRMEDVTEKVLKGVTGEMGETDRNRLIDSNSMIIAKSAIEGTGYSATVRPFYMGNQYFLFVNNTYRDIRLVGAPPSAIGKFGGETDNWIWPRHTGDFSLFRIYAGKDNGPADFSSSNVPFKPVYSFPISVKGITEGDFTMVFGYPGTTYEYVPSYHVDMVRNFLNPKMINIRAKKIEIIEAAMNSDPLIRIQYYAKKANLANSWKKWIGESQGLDKMGTIEKKREYEVSLTSWILSDNTRKQKYAGILPRYKELYSGLNEYRIVNSFTNEVFSNNGVETFSLALALKPLANLFTGNADPDQIKQMKTKLVESGKNFFRNFNKDTDKKLFVAALSLYGTELDLKWQSTEYIKLKNSCGGNFSAIVDKLYDKSVFANEEKYTAFVSEFNETSISKLKKDPFYIIVINVNEFLDANVKPQLLGINEEVQLLNREYMTCQMEFDKERVFYPDANSTLRVTYGNIKGYFSKDAVYFTYFTTLKGIMEKDNPGIYDYDVPEKLRQLYKNRDYGRYTQNGEVPVCFIANNHTTGGNSGSPVINAEGQLIGVNFDRAWEGVASDLAFNPDQSRNISLDIRYVLFIIDKFAGAGYLLKEMTIVD